MRLRSVVVLIVMAGVGTPGCALFGGGKPPVVVSGAEVPREAQTVLSEKWQGWTPAELDPQATSCQPAGGTAPLAVIADLDSDTKADLALQIKTAEGIKLVALMRRGEEYAVFELDKLGDGQSPTYLGLEKRGTRFPSPLTSTDDFYAADTLATYKCGKPIVHYLWTGLGFKRVEIGKLP